MESASSKTERLSTLQEPAPNAGYFAVLASANGRSAVLARHGVPTGRLVNGTSALPRLPHVGLLDRWGKANQRRAEADNEALGGDDWVERLNERTLGPEWAWKLHAIPGLGWIGAIVIAISSLSRRRGGDPGGAPKQ